MRLPFWCVRINLIGIEIKVVVMHIACWTGNPITQSLKVFSQHFTLALKGENLYRILIGLHFDCLTVTI